MTRRQPITPLIARSGYSALRGPTPLERLVRDAAALGHEHLALTDTNGLYGLRRFWRLAADADLTPIVGAELRAPAGPAATALVADEAGYRNLCRLLTVGHADGGADGFAFPPPARMVEHLAGLRLLTEDAALARRLVGAGAAADRLFLAVDPAAQSPADRRRIVREAEELGLPIAAAGKALFARREEYEVARVLAAVRTRTTRDTVPADALPPPGARLRGPEELAGAPGDLPPAAARNNRRLVEECSGFRLLPRKPVFPGYDTPDGEAPPTMLRRLCREGVRRRYGRSRRAVEDRLARELALIERRGFVEYFLVVRDIVHTARGRGAPVAGRGSGASSLVAYVLGITNVCPLAFDIPFERFLNDRRTDFPDLDIDFCWRIRDDVIDYALARWGRSRTAMICTHNTFQQRSAFRETAKAFGLSDEQISALRPADTERDPRLAEIGRLSHRLIGLLHNLSVHPGGVVIAPAGIDRHVPVEPAPKGVPITQYDKDGVEDIGLVKLDLLGNRSLSTIRAACDLVREHTGRVVDVEALPGEDAPTLATLRAADTVGCNQIESPAMRHLLRALAPDDPRGLMQALALIRPGAASIGMKETFIRRRRGLEPVPPDVPAVAGILGGTHGVMLYEDDVMLVAAAMLGSDLPDADRFRKAVQKCRSDAERLALSREFVSRCTARGLPADYAKGMWVQMAKFNAYSFCRAHAASYAMLAYASAWLKTHHPLEFWIACLNNNQSMYHPRVYVEQAKRGGVRFLLPDVNRSGEDFTADEHPDGGRGVRVGLGRVGGLGPAGVEAILAARRERPYDSLTDFLSRTALGRDEARTLIQCGAMDALGPNRPTLMMELNLFLSMRPHRRPDQPALLAARPTVPVLPDDYSPTRRYVEQRRALQISVGPHVMGLHRPRLAGQSDADSRDLPDRVGRKVRIAGVLEAQRAARTQAGQTMLFLTLDDEYGLFEATVFPGVYSAVGVLDRYGPYLISGWVQEQYGSVTVTAETVEACHARVA